MSYHFPLRVMWSCVYGRYYVAFHFEDIEEFIKLQKYKELSSLTCIYVEYLILHICLMSLYQVFLNLSFLWHFCQIVSGHIFFLDSVVSHKLDSCSKITPSYLQSRKIKSIVHSQMPSAETQGHWARWDLNIL